MLFILTILINVLALPAGCDSYAAPHNLQCYKTIFSSAGCTKDGKLYPRLENMVSDVSEKNIR